MVDSVPFPTLLPSTTKLSSQLLPAQATGRQLGSRRKRVAAWSTRMIKSWSQRFLGFDEASVARFLRMLTSDRDSKKLIAYLCVSAALIAIKFLVGIGTLNVDLIALSMTNMFDSIVLLFALICMTFSRKPADMTFSYGYGRFEIISAFTISCFLLFNALFTFLESVHHLVASHPDPETPYKAFEVIGLLINVFGMVMFRPDWAQALRHSGHSRMSPSARQCNVYAILLYLGCEALFRSVSFLGLILPHGKGVHFALTFSGAILAGYLACPVFASSVRILLQTRPAERADSIRNGVRDICVLEGVLECRSAQFWSLVPEDVVGTIRIRVRSDADEAMILTS